MKILAKKTKHLSAFVFRLIWGMFMSAAVVVVLPVSLLVADSSLFENLTFTSIIFAIMIVFGLISWFFYIKPYLIYRKMPEIQAETDGEYLYIHTDKEAKIAFADMDGAYFDADVPTMVTKEFFVIHLLSERYGNVIIDIPNYGEYKLYYVADAENVMRTIADLANKKLNEE